MPWPSRILIVNADDFGRSAAVNDGIMRAHEQGIVTSASLMVRWPDAEPAAELAAARPSSPSACTSTSASGSTATASGGRVYEVLEEETPGCGGARAREPARAVRAAGRARARPTSTPTSTSTATCPPGAPCARAGERLGVPVRHFTPEITYSGAFFGQDGKGNPFPEAITVEALVSVIEGLPPGITELACHPAAAAEGVSVYDEERVVEVEQPV